MQDLTIGSISRHLLKTASFMLVTMVFQTLYFLVDLYFVGRLGKEAVAGVGVAGNLTFIVLALTQMLAVGTTTLVSHAVGQRNEPRALLVFNQSQVLSAVAGALFLVVAMAARTAYAEILAADAITAQLAAAYLLYYLPAMALQFLMGGMAAALRGVGNFKPGMIVQTATIIINIVLAPTLMFGVFGLPRMGVGGAAMATLAAVVIGTLWLSTYFFGREGYLRFHRPDLSPRLGLWADMLKAGLPAGAEFLMMGVYLILVSALARPFGAAAQAGFVIGMRVVQALLHAGRGARLLGRTRGGSKRRRPPRRSREDGVQGGEPDGDRYRILAHRGVDVRLLGADLRLLEHVPGDGQHHAVARRLGHPHRRHRDPGNGAVDVDRIPARVGLVSVRRGGRAPARDRAALPAARIPPPSRRDGAGGRAPRRTRLQCVKYGLVSPPSGV